MFHAEWNSNVCDVIVKGNGYVLYDSKNNTDACCCLEEVLEKAAQESMEFLY